MYVSVADNSSRRKLLFLAALPVLAAGLQLIPYVVLLIIFGAVAERRVRKGDIFAILLGILVGAAALVGYFAVHHSGRAYLAQTFASNNGTLGTILQIILLHSQHAVETGLARLRDLLPVNMVRMILLDRTIAPIGLFFVIAIVALWRTDRNGARRIAVLGLVATLGIPYGMLISGRYPLYYGWMCASVSAVINRRTTANGSVCWIRCAAVATWSQSPDAPRKAARRAVFPIPGGPSMARQRATGVDSTVRSAPRPVAISRSRPIRADMSSPSSFEEEGISFRAGASLGPSLREPGVFPDFWGAPSIVRCDHGGPHHVRSRPNNLR